EPKEGREQGTEGALWWERTTRLLDTPELTPASGNPRGRVYAIDVRVVWEDKRHLEVSTLRMLPPEGTQTGLIQVGIGLGGAPRPASPGTSPLGTLFGRPQ